ncbi:MAG: hypothetical protein LBF68_03940 [Christensenellaceae bacterium]|nr:hypothetical protein [Christensenellaceae bacterium]
MENWCNDNEYPPNSITHAISNVKKNREPHHQAAVRDGSEHLTGELQAGEIRL